MAADEPIGGNRLEGEPGDDAEVAATAPHRPEQVGVRIGVDPEHLAACGDELDLAQRVDREALHAHEPPDAAAEREPAHADVAGVAGTDAEAVRGERGRDVTPVGTAADRDEAVVADLDRGELGQVDDQAVFDGHSPWPPLRTAIACPAAAACATASATSSAVCGRTTASGSPMPAKTVRPASNSVSPGPKARPGTLSLRSVSNDISTV